MSTYLSHLQVPGTRWDYGTLQELQQHVHSAIPEQVSVLLLVLNVVVSCKGLLALWQPLVKERMIMIWCTRAYCCDKADIDLAQCVQE